MHTQTLLHPPPMPAAPQSRGPRETLSFPPKDSPLAGEKSHPTERGRGIQQNTRKYVDDGRKTSGEWPDTHDSGPNVSFQQSGDK